MPYIIDGHNLLHSINKAGLTDGHISDIAMCQAIGQYLIAIEEKGEIVFDGKGPPEKTVFEHIRNLEVTFVGTTTDADSVIEDKIKINTAPKRLSIISSDRRVIKAARTRRATAIKSEAFWNEVQKKSNRKNKFREPRQKRHGLTESETEQWLELFGIEQ